MNVLKHIQGSPWPTPTLCSAPSFPGLASAFVHHPHSSSCVYVVMVTVQGWANVQQQFDRLVHFEYKPTPKENTVSDLGCLLSLPGSPWRSEKTLQFVVGSSVVSWQICHLLVKWVWQFVSFFQVGFLTCTQRMMIWPAAESVSGEVSVRKIQRKEDRLDACTLEHGCESQGGTPSPHTN